MTCSIHKKVNKNRDKIYYRIYIFGKSLHLLHSLVSKYFCPSMLYKIQLEEKPKLLSQSKKNIKAREERERRRLWKTEHGTLPPQNTRVLSNNPRAINKIAREKRLLLKSLKSSDSVLPTDKA